MSHESIMPSVCYFCSFWKPDEATDSERKNNFREGLYGAPAGKNGICLASDFEETLVTKVHVKKHEENHVTKAQTPCHVTLDGEEVFEVHPQFDEEKYHKYLSEMAKGLDTHE